MPSGELTLRPPTPGDGAALWRIACEVGLDRNSPYKYLVFCRDFAGSSVVALDGDEPVGFVTGYRRPTEPGTLFVWQVGVAAAVRGRGVASAMLDHLAGRPAAGPPPAVEPPAVGQPMVGQSAGAAAPSGSGPGAASCLEATVTPDNAASMRLFTAFAERHGARIERSVLFPAALFPEPHGDEVLLRIGPF